MYTPWKSNVFFFHLTSKIIISKSLMTDVKQSERTVSQTCLFKVRGWQLHFVHYAFEKTNLFWNYKKTIKNNHWRSHFLFSHMVLQSWWKVTHEWADTVCLRKWNEQLKLMSLLPYRVQIASAWSCVTLPSWPLSHMKDESVRFWICEVSIVDIHRTFHFQWKP